MLQIYPVVLEVVVKLRPVMAVIDRKDRDLGRQLRRCSQSAGLNLAEGMYSRGRNRAAKYHVALGSAREMLACLELAEAFGYTNLDEGVRSSLNRIVGTTGPPGGTGWVGPSTSWLDMRPCKCGAAAKLRRYNDSYTAR